MARILVIGGGIAGCSAATFLAASGMEVVVFERRPEKREHSLPKHGESLPPDARTLLEQLGVWQKFQSDGHFPCHYHKSYWGTEEASFRDFVNHPLGHGWHLDRIAFDQMLEKRCHDAGVTFQYDTTLKEVDATGSGWLVNGTEAFDFIVDASGRHSCFAKKMGIDRFVDESQLALIAFLKSDQDLEDSSSLTESTEQGWWYSAAIPGQLVATAFIGKPDTFQRKQWRTEQGWWDLIAQAPHTEKRLRETNFSLLATPRLVPAESSILESLVGKNWLAVGDAALSYDPVASHGIMMAMVSARDAAKTINSYVQGHETALAQYDETLRHSFSQYASIRRALYDQLAPFA